MSQSHNEIMNKAMEMTLNEIHPGDDDYVGMEARVMSRVHNMVALENSWKSKGEPRMRAPNRLEPAQIAALLAKAMEGRLRSVGQSPEKRGTLEVRPGLAAWDEWSSCTDEICRACIAMDYRITRGGIAATIDRLLFLVPRAEDMAV